MGAGKNSDIANAEPPLVSVTVCCYNCQEWIAQTIQSVLDQTFENWELVLINDGSTDNSEGIIRGFSDSRILYEYQENRGLPLARNRALELARGKYVAFLDHDDLWEPNKLEMQVGLLEQRPDVALVFSDCYLIGPDGHRFGTFFQQWRSSRIPSRGHVLKDLLLEGCFMPVMSVMVRKEILVKVGGFNPNYTLAEDYEAWLRVADGRIVDFINQPLCSYRVHDSSVSVIQQERGFHEMLDILSVRLNQSELSWWFKFRLGLRYADCVQATTKHFRRTGRRNESRGLLMKTFLNDPKHMIWCLPFALGPVPALLRYSKILYNTLRESRPGRWPVLLRSLWREHGERNSKSGWKTS